jgi:hypothetical protein
MIGLLSENVAHELSDLPSWSFRVPAKKSNKPWLILITAGDLLSASAIKAM